jgi:ubiquinone/menaquinone biosynthesis C-methylase UbiE
MSQLERVRTAVRRHVFHQFEPKGDAEFEFWRKTREDAGGTLKNDYYEQLFTDQFGLSREFFADKRILDLGCGPRGSLEWATEAERRVGLDPLVDRYRNLGIDKHTMEYCSAPAENMPFSDESFDIVSSLNSLDHVDDLHSTLSEITRVLVPGGSFLVEVEFGHRPTDTEPVEIPRDFAESLRPAFQVLLQQRFAAPPKRVHSAYIEAVPYEDGKRFSPGVMILHLVKQ